MHVYIHVHVPQWHCYQYTGLQTPQPFYTQYTQSLILVLQPEGEGGRKGRREGGRGGRGGREGGREGRGGREGGREGEGGWESAGGMSVWSNLTFSPTLEHSPSRAHTLSGSCSY